MSIAVAITKIKLSKACFLVFHFFQDLKLQTEDSFILKIVQLEELLAVRHSVFVLGPAGTGKTQVIKTLNKTYQNQKRKPLLHDINPKAVTADELFGFINPATREWKDGKRCLESSVIKVVFTLTKPKRYLG